MNKKVIMLALEDKQVAMLEEIAGKIGVSKVQPVIRQAIFEYHKELFKPYLIKKPKPTAEEQAVLDIEKAEAMRKVKSEKTYDDQKAIADALEGEIYDEAGVIYCRFKVYEYMNPSYVHEGVMTLPLDELREDLLEIKWKGGKEKILSILNK